MFNWLFDLKVKRITRGTKSTYPPGYHEYVKQICDNLPEQSVTISHRAVCWQPILTMALLVVCIGAYPATAVIQKYMGRMEAMEPCDRQNFVDGVDQSKVNRDTYSRELTQAEKERRTAIQKKYQNGDICPESSLLEITDTTQIINDRICFLAENSTFYLPDRKLADEELLELIDFSSKRDYSILTKGTEKTKKEDITESQAEKLASTWLMKIYEKDAKDYTVRVNYNETVQEKEIYKSYFTNFIDEETGQFYFVDINISTGELNMIQCLYNGERENTMTGIKENKDKYREIYKKTVRKMLGKLDIGRKISSATCEYNIAAGELEKGCINYEIRLDDNSGFILKYSMNSDFIFGISFIKNFDDYKYDDAIDNENGKKVLRRKLTME